MTNISVALCVCVFFLQKFLSKMRVHYKTCRKYLEEFGPISEPTAPLTAQPPAVPPSSVIIPNVPVPTPPDRYVSTFKLHHHTTDILRGKKNAETIPRSWCKRDPVFTLSSKHAVTSQSEIRPWRRRRDERSTRR